MRYPRPVVTDSLDDFTRTMTQGLVDLAASGASDVVFLDGGKNSPAKALSLAEQAALSLDFAVAAVDVEDERGFESLDALVASLVKQLTCRKHDKKGLVPFLDGFARRTRSMAAQRFAEAAEAAELRGDLTELVQSYFESESAQRKEARVLKAFFEGDAIDHPRAMSSLSARNAKRTLADLTRLLRALGSAGLLVSVRHAQRLVDRTPKQRETAYTVLRELIDNNEGARGMVGTRIVVGGSHDLLSGRRSLVQNAPLLSRIVLSDEEVQHFAPHAPLVRLHEASPREAARDIAAPSPRKAKSVRALVRACQGLPAFELIDELTVGYEKIERTVDQLFAHAEQDASVFSLLSGDYGSGKTHLLLYLTARALEAKRPVLRLAVERLDTDLGNPQRHLRRLLHNALLPGNLASPLERLEAWTSSRAQSKKLERQLEEIYDEVGDPSPAALRAIRHFREGPQALADYLDAADLEERTAQPNYRADAYGRLLLWLELLRRMDGTEGPVVLIDEAENLYRTGTSRPERRTALRSLAFYCGGVLPRACVVLAVTPETLAMLREEAEEVLDEVSEQKTLLGWEDTAMLRRRLLRSRPLDVAKLGPAQLRELAERVRTLHRSVRGSTKDPQWEPWLDTATRGRPSPRQLIRRTTTRLEALWWSGRAAI